MPTDRPLTTADLANAEDVRARSHEQIRGFDVAPAPPPTNDEAVRPAAAQPRDQQSGEKSRVVRAERNEPRQEALFAEHDTVDLRNRWSEIQTGFVDEPRRAVEQADSLVADVMKRLAESFAAERSSLEKQWDRGDSVTTEDLRVALQRYRSFFDRLLTM
jgi:hypothetical protein